VDDAVHEALRLRCQERFLLKLEPTKLSVSFSCVADVLAPPDRAWNDSFADLREKALQAWEVRAVGSPPDPLIVVEFEETGL
jgi:hypothetical protein